MPDYQHLTEDELLNLAQERDQLTDEARALLDGELSRRRIGAGEIKTYKEESDSIEKAEELRRAKLSFMSHRGLGKKFLGKARRRRDASGKFEEYDSTLWFTAFYLPVFPIASYTVRRDLTKWLGMTFASDEMPIQRHSRDWNQILQTWVKTAALLLALCIAFRLLEAHPEWLR